MIQHPIPQNVTGYQFRLIGDMTIKQFIMLSLGIGGAIFFYYTNLFSPLKWIFVITSGMGGFALAFLPFEERPLDQWITNYVRAIYRPTQYIWFKRNQPPNFFGFTPLKNTPAPGDLEEISRQAATRREQGLRSYLVTLPDETVNTDSWEQEYTQQITSLFNAAAPPLLDSSPASTLNIANFNTNNTAPAAETEPQETPALPSKKPLLGANVSSGVIALEKIHIEKPEPAAAAQPLVSLSNSTGGTSDIQSNTLASEVIDVSKVVAPTTTPELPFPSAPTTPNTLVGMVLTSEGKIVEAAIVEVIDESGLPVRATKTNQLGQFFSTTPLKRGVYHVTIEKPGLTFDTIELNIVGSIVPPLKIQAKKT